MSEWSSDWRVQNPKRSPGYFWRRQSVIFLHFTNFFIVHQKNLDQIYIINGALSDRYERYSKEYSCLSNYGHTHACDNYYTNMYIISHLIE